MIEKQTAAGIIFKWLLRIMLTLFALLPIYAAVIIALTPGSHVMNMQIFPKFFEVMNFLTGFNSIGNGIKNSFFYSIVSQRF